MDRILQEIAVPVNQAKIDSPGVNCNAVKTALLICPCNSYLNLLEQVREIPVDRAIEGNRIVLKTMDFPELNFPVLEGSEHCPAAGSAKVKSQYFFRHFNFPFLKLN